MVIAWRSPDTILRNYSSVHEQRGHVVDYDDRDMAVKNVDIPLSCYLLDMSEERDFSGLVVLPAYVGNETSVWDPSVTRIIASDQGPVL